MYELSDKEFEAVQSLNADYRKAHCLDKVKEQGGLYILLMDDEPFVLEDTEEDDDKVKSSVLPVWCHERYVNAYIEGEKLENCKAQFVTAKAWNENWVKPLAENQALIGFMLVSGGDFAVDEPQQI